MSLEQTANPLSAVKLFFQIPPNHKFLIKTDKKSQFFAPAAPPFDNFNYAQGMSLRHDF